MIGINEKQKELKAVGVSLEFNPSEMEIVASEDVLNTIVTNVHTSKLVQELKKREGVEVMVAEPYQSVNIEVSGPAVVLIVTD